MLGLASNLRGFLFAFVVAMVAFAVIRATWNPSRDTLFIAWVTLACMVLAFVAAQADSLATRHRWNVLALLLAPVLIFAATWLLFAGSLVAECSGAGSPFFDLSCN